MLLLLFMYKEGIETCQNDYEIKIFEKINIFI